MSTPPLSLSAAYLLHLLSDYADMGEYPSLFAAEKFGYFIKRFGVSSFSNINFELLDSGPSSSGRVSSILLPYVGSYIKGFSNFNSSSSLSLLSSPRSSFDIIWFSDNAALKVVHFMETNLNEDSCRMCKDIIAFLRPFYSTFSLQLLGFSDYLIVNSKFDLRRLDHSRNFLRNYLYKEVQRVIHSHPSLVSPEDIEITLQHLLSSKLYLS